MIKKVAVLGAGVMGMGIAAQIANNGYKVLLFDLENEEGLISEQAIKKQLDSRISSFVHPSIAENITPQNLNKDLPNLQGYDLIIEAIIENLDVKQKLYKNLAKYASKNTIIASNTSTFRLTDLKSKLPVNISKNLVICHFFNPPRYMRLLELISGDLEENLKNNLLDFLTDIAGKDVIICKDSPGFIANRIGCFLMELVFQESLKNNLKIEEIDYIFTNYLGFPNTGIFGLYDLIGLDLMKYISGSLLHSLPQQDEFAHIHKEIPGYNKLISEGYTGKKGKGGFYVIKQNKDGDKEKFSLNLKNFEHEKSIIPQISYNDKNVKEFIDKILDKFSSYVQKITPEIADNIYDIDKAMKLGFGLKMGPYALMQKFGRINIEIDNSKSNISPNSLSMFELIKESADYKIYKLAKDKICFSINTKMNVLTREVFNGIIDSVSIAEKHNSDLIIYSDSPHFSAGADLKYFLELTNENDSEKIEEYLKLGQKAMLSLKYSASPVISVARGVALGGGCEILLHSDYIIAHQELKAGLVESSIGLIPSWGGLTEMVLRSDSNNLNKNLGLVIEGYKSSSALDFKIKYNLHNNFEIFSNNNKILEYAVRKKYQKSANNRIIDKVIFDSHNSESKELCGIFQKKLQGSLSEDDLLNLEREIFMQLIFKEKTKKLLSKFT